MSGLNAIALASINPLTITLNVDYAHLNHFARENIKKMENKIIVGTKNCLFRRIFFMCLWRAILIKLTLFKSIQRGVNTPNSHSFKN